MKRALILDLDNTIYPVSSIAERLFGNLFKLIDESLEDKSAAAAAKLELTRRPFQHVADEFGFGAELKDKGITLLNNLTFDGPMQAFSAYKDIRAIPIDKYLVTTGFTKLQISKVKSLNIEADFKKIFVVDPDLSNQTKKDIFAMILKDNAYTVNDVLVIGDDPQSEIKAALELGIDTFLFDPESKYPYANVTYRGADYTEVARIIRE